MNDMYEKVESHSPFIYAIVNLHMNLNTNALVTGNFMLKVNFKSIIMGILLLAATFSLLASNTIATESFAQSTNNVVGCAHEVTVTITGLPKQTD